MKETAVRWWKRRCGARERFRENDLGIRQRVFCVFLFFSLCFANLFNNERMFFLVTKGFIFTKALK
jgi:hypothetical protein